MRSSTWIAARRRTVWDRAETFDGHVLNAHTLKQAQQVRCARRVVIRRAQPWRPPGRTGDTAQALSRAHGSHAESATSDSVAGPPEAVVGVRRRYMRGAKRRGQARPHADRSRPAKEFGGQAVAYPHLGAQTKWFLPRKRREVMAV